MARLRSRKSIRLRGFDYTQAGAYFVTLVTAQRADRFGSIEQGAMRPNGVGDMVLNEWQALPSRFSGLTVDAFVLMPNHLHGILFLGGEATAAAQPALGTVILSFKSVTTRHFHLICRNLREPLWQRNFYERIVRGPRELEDIQKYILTNPAQWEFDQENLNGKRG